MPAAVALAVSYATASAVAAGTLGAMAAWGISTAVSVVASMAMRKRGSSVTPERTLNDRKQVIRNSVTPRTIVYGRARVSGPLIFAESTGINHEFLHLVIPIAGHIIKEYEQIWINDEIVSLFDDYKVKNKLWSKSYKGNEIPIKIIIPSGFMRDSGCYFMLGINSFVSNFTSGDVTLKLAYINSPKLAFGYNDFTIIDIESSNGIISFPESITNVTQCYLYQENFNNGSVESLNEMIYGYRITPETPDSISYIQYNTLNISEYFNAPLDSQSEISNTVNTYHNFSTTIPNYNDYGAFNKYRVKLVEPINSGQNYFFISKMDGFLLNYPDKNIFLESIKIVDIPITPGGANIEEEYLEESLFGTYYSTIGEVVSIEDDGYFIKCTFKENFILSIESQLNLTIYGIFATFKLKSPSIFITKLHNETDELSIKYTFFDNNAITDSYIHIYQDTGTYDAYLKQSSPAIIALRENCKQIGWTDNHLLLGIAFLYIRLEYDMEKFMSGLPNFSAVIKGKYVYPSSGTREYSNNWAVIVKDYLTSGGNISYPLHYGLDIPTDIIDNDSYEESRDYSIPSDGILTNYEINGVINLDERPIDILEKMMSAANGTLIYSEGKYYIKCAKPVASESLCPILNENYLRGSVKIQACTPLSELSNGIKTTFLNPDNNWQESDIEPIQSPTYLSYDKGLEKYLSLQLPYTIDSKMASYLSKTVLKKSRHGMTVNLECNFRVFNLRVGDVIKLQIPNLFDNKLFKITSWKINENFEGIDLILREEYSSDYSYI